MTETTKVSTKVTGWKKKAIHDITLPSGEEVTIRIPNLPHLIKTGQIPNELVNAAIGAIDATPSREAIEQQADMYNKLVSITVLEPAVDESDVPELPFEDIEMIVEIATRQRDIDAVGHHIGGLEKSDEFRKFRSLGFSSEGVEGL